MRKTERCPAEIVALVGYPAAGARLKSCPTPESATVCGVLEALSVMVIVPAILPLAAGSKKTFTTQFWPVWTPLEQVSVSPKLLEA